MQDSLAEESVLTQTERKIHPRSLANLILWQKGQSGNPSGRPKKKPITERYEQILETNLTEEELSKTGLPESATYGDAIALGMARASLKGDSSAAREMRHAIEGKEAIEGGGESGGIKVLIINANYRPPRSEHAGNVIDTPQTPS